jgi:cytoskeletal protein CcmA (bactofilin family)
MFNKSKVIEKYHSAVEKIAMADSQSGSQNLKLLPGASSMIGVDVKIDGKIVSEQNLVIEGAVKGSITAKKAEVLVGKTGSLTANISAKVVRIEGTVTGDICGSENVIIANTGNVLGNIDSPRVSLEDGAKF